MGEMDLSDVASNDKFRSDVFADIARLSTENKVGVKDYTLALGAWEVEEGAFYNRCIFNWRWHSDSYI